MLLMEVKMTEFFREMLQKQLDDLFDRASQTVGVLIRPSDAAADPLDQAASDSDRNYTLRIRDRESHLIKKIKIALAKLDDGTFGICENCEEEIALERLIARPVTAYCIRCKTNLEAAEKRHGT